MSETPQCPHEVIRATCPGCNCPCRGCDRVRDEWAAIEATRSADEGTADDHA